MASGNIGFVKELFHRISNQPQVLPSSGMLKFNVTIHQLQIQINLSLRHNRIKVLPVSIEEYSTLLLDVSHNELTDLPFQLLKMSIDATNNNIAGVLPAYRGNKDKVLHLQSRNQMLIFSFAAVKLSEKYTTTTKCAMDTN